MTIPQESFSQYLPQQLVRWRAVSIGLSLLAFGIGGAAFLGWIFDNEYLKRIHPSLVTMKANTAVCLMLTAAAVILIQDPSRSTVKRRLIQLFAAIVSLVGLITLSEHLLGWNSGLDQLLFYESLKEAGRSFPGRMGIAASLNFSLFGPALLLLDARSRRWFRVSNISVLMVIAITLLVFLYYFYGIDQNERVGPYFTIALHTVVAFLALCAAVLLARPERGLIATPIGSVQDLPPHFLF